MAAYEITAKMNLKNIIAEAREVAQVLNEFAENLENIEEKYADADAEFHCGVEESGGHAYNCNDCPNKCDEFNQWDKEIKEKGDKDANKLYFQNQN